MPFEKVNTVGVFYGPRTVENKLPSVLNTDGTVRELVIDFDFNSLPSTDATDALVLAIPANSLIESAVLTVKTAFAGGTSLAVGLSTTAGVAVDADGLITDANAPLANVNAAGKIVKGSGALVGVSSGSAATQVTVTATGTFTAGKATLVVKYSVAP